MGADNHSDMSTYNLLEGLRWLVSTVIIRVISTLNLQVLQRPNPKKHTQIPVNVCGTLNCWANIGFVREGGSSGVCNPSLTNPNTP